MKLTLTSIFFKSNKDHHHQTNPSPCCTTTPPPPLPAWAWPSCKHPRTHSFRRTGDMYKTLNSVFVDSPEQEQEQEQEQENDDQVESFIRGLRSERLFFDRGGESSSIIEEGKNVTKVFKKESVVEEMESENPYVDFKMSMEEMVSAHGLKEWEGLEEMLQSYLSVNGKTTHGFILGAFLDLLLDLVSPFAAISTTSPSSSPSSSLSSSSSSCVN